MSINEIFIEDSVNGLYKLHRWEIFAALWFTVVVSFVEIFYLNNNHITLIITIIFNIFVYVKFRIDSKKTMVNKINRLRTINIG